MSVGIGDGGPENDFTTEGWGLGGRDVLGTYAGTGLSAGMVVGRIGIYCKTC